MAHDFTVQSANRDAGGVAQRIQLQGLVACARCVDHDVDRDAALGEVFEKARDLCHAEAS